MSRTCIKKQLSVEALEHRFMAGSVYEPTGLEQFFLELLNAARAFPAGYGRSIGLNLDNVAAAQPLAFNLKLMESARKHSQDMNDRNFFAHVNPSGQGPGDRIDAAGYDWTAYGESLAAGYDTVEATLRALIIDDGIPDLGHRKHLLGIDSVSATTPEVGIGIIINGTGTYQHYYTTDTARDFSPYDAIADDYFLTGVVYNDQDGNNFYTPGEGYGGVTIEAVAQSSGATFSVMTFGSGGYSLRLPAGTYSVTASGGEFPGPLDTTVTIGARNRKLDFLPDGPSDGPMPWGGSASAELAVWSGQWSIDANANGQWDGAAGDLSYKFGKTKSSVPAPLDWNGDGFLELAVFKKGKYLQIDSNGNHAWDGDRRDTQILLGNGGDQAVLGDWNGDGRDDLGILRNEDGKFHLDTNGDRVLDAQDARFAFDTFRPGDIAVVGDWNGDGRDDIGYFRAGNTFMIDSDGDRSWNPAADLQSTVAMAAARPAAADFNGDGHSQIAAFSNGTFHIDSDYNGSLDLVKTFQVGLYPVPGNWA